MNVVQVNCRYGASLDDPDALLDRYTTLTGWSTALLGAGARSVTVVQQFHRDARVARDGVDYIFRRSGIGRTVAGLRPDIVHVNGLDSPRSTAALRIALGTRTPIIVQDHASQVLAERGGRVERRARRLMRRVLMRVADAFMFTAAELADAWRDVGLIGDRQRVYEVVESSTAMTPVDRRSARAASGVAGSPALLWVGRLDANKDPLVVLDGLERSFTNLPDARLTMVFSTDDLLGEVRARLAASEALSTRVRLVGRVEHRCLAAYYSAADVFVLGSHREGSGYALLEACACGALPLVTDIPTFRAITGRGAVGVLWPAGEPSALASALRSIATTRLDGSRAQVLAHFDRALTWQSVGRNAIAAYRDLLSIPRTRR
jgi:glycosyltransferase involved in cell wall biosynthesis